VHFLSPKIHLVDRPDILNVVERIGTEDVKSALSPRAMYSSSIS
jgi:hypothetical protein